ncbi:MAG: hypothetical protein RJA58_613 [Pseudomonadota bacterium]|jgi:hypothetical protein
MAEASFPQALPVNTTQTGEHGLLKDILTMIGAEIWLFWISD